MVYTEEYLTNAHKHSAANKEAILLSEYCGCFYCFQVFPPDEIINWAEDENGNGDTAICSYCGIDSVLGSSSGLPVTRAVFLEEMNKRWF